MELIRFYALLSLGLTGLCLVLVPLLEWMGCPEASQPQPQDPCAWRPGLGPRS